MSTRPVLRAASGGLLRGRLVQTVVIFLVLTASTATALLGLALVTSANEGFYAGFAAHHGADLAVAIDPARATNAQLAVTRSLPGVTQAAGPYPETVVTLEPSSGPGRSGEPGTTGTSPGNGPGQGRQPAAGPGGGGPGGAVASLSGLTVAGRTSASGPLDDISVTAGRWATRPGEIVLAHAPGIRVGGKVTVTSVPGQPQLTVAGFASSPGQEEGAWVVPSEIAALTRPGTPARVQMLYSFTRAATAAQIDADLATVRAALPAGAVTGSASWLHSVTETSTGQSVNTPFVVAFAVIGLVLSVLISASVISAGVVAGYRRIGVLKSIGFTPAQVTAAYTGQAGSPALAGCLAGTGLGDGWVLPLLNSNSAAASIATATVPLWINIAVPPGILALAVLAALIPVARAGRVPAIQVITTAQAPAAGHGYAAHRLALPRPVTIGLAAPFARPARSAVTLAAITFGLTAVVMAVGLDSTLTQINHSAVQSQGQVQVALLQGRGSLTSQARQQQTLTAALRAQPGTLRYAGEAETGAPGSRPVITVPVLGQVPVSAYVGDPGWLRPGLISGRWYHAPGEADADAPFLTQTGRSVGDTMTMTVNGTPVRVRIVGEAFVISADPALLTSWQTLGSAAVGLAWQYDIELKPGTSTQAYASGLGRILGPGFAVVAAPQSASSFAATADTSLIGLLTVVIAVLAGLGVLNSVLMLTRERVRDLGVFKAVGMTPRQAIAMVICWIIPPAVIAAAIALPAGITLQHVVAQAIGAVAGTGIPAASSTSTRPLSSCCSRWPDWRSPSPARSAPPAGQPRPKPPPPCTPNSRSGPGSSPAS